MNREHASRVMQFQDIKRLVPLATVLERYGVLSELKRVGRQLFGVCPIHNGTNKKQFVVDLNKDSGLWRCFGDCDRGGDALTFVAAMERVEIPEAARLVRDWFALAPLSDVHKQQHRKQRSIAMSGRPSHKAFVVEDKEEGSDEKPFWTRCGSAWPHKDGKGLNVQIAPGLAVFGRLVLREYTEEDAKEEEQQKSKRKK